MSASEQIGFGGSSPLAHPDLPESSSGVESRKDRAGTVIKKGSKKHHITFKDQLLASEDVS
jgi:hypothetical protein